MSRRWRTVSMLVVPLLLAAGMTTATEPPTDETIATPEQGIPVSFAGMQVFFDPESGQMRAPTPQEARQFAEAMSRLFGRARRTAAAPETRPDGTVVLELDLSQMDFTMARVRADGTLQLDHVEDATQALAVVAAPTHTATGEDE